MTFTDPLEEFHTTGESAADPAQPQGMLADAVYPETDQPEPAPGQRRRLLRMLPLVTGALVLCALLVLLIVYVIVRRAGSADKPLFNDLADRGGVKVTQITDENGTEQRLVDLGTPRTVGFLRLKWAPERMAGYVIETSEDGVNYAAAVLSDTAPYLAEEEYAVSPAVTARYVRVTVSARPPAAAAAAAGTGADQAADGTAIDSTPENGGTQDGNTQGGDAAPMIAACEVYETDPWQAVCGGLSAVLVSEGGARRAALAGLPEGIEAEFAGCDLEQVIGSDGTAAETIEDKTVRIGFLLRSGDWTRETPNLQLRVPAAAAPGGAGDSVNARPAVIPGIQEWAGGTGWTAVTGATAVVVRGGAPAAGQESGPVQADGSPAGAPSADDLAEAAAYLRAQLPDILLAAAKSEGSNGAGPSGVSSPGAAPSGAASAGFITLLISDDAMLGREGYRMTIGSDIVLEARTRGGLTMGMQTLFQMMMRGPLPHGVIRDYPLADVRGFSIDVARNDVSPDTLERMLPVLAWYKMNELTLHLSDNALLTYSDKTDTPEHAMEAYSAFRLASGITGTNGKALSAADRAYTRDDMRAIIEKARALGIRIVPEIDTPAHSLAITSAFPELALRARPDSVDMLDTEQPEALETVRGIWAEQLDGADAALAGADVVHIGGDEYYGPAEAYLAYEKGLIADLSAQYGRGVRMWACLSAIRGGTFIDPLLPDGSGRRVELCLWHASWADPSAMYHAGFDIINANSRQLYLTPGGGNDHPDLFALAQDFSIDRIPTADGSGAYFLPAYSPRLRGAVLVMWNDLTDNIAAGISEYDMALRMCEAAPVFASRCWNESGDIAAAVSEGSRAAGYAPGAAAGTGSMAAAAGRASCVPPVAELLDRPGSGSFTVETGSGDEGAEPFRQGEEARAIAPDGRLLLGPNWRLTMEVRMDSLPEGPEEAAEAGETEAPEGSEEAEGPEAPAPAGQDILRAERGGNTYRITLRQDGDGCVGFSREGDVYSFPYSLPEEEWVRLEFVGRDGTVTLYADGEEIGACGSAAPFEMHATMLLPLVMPAAEDGGFRGDIRMISAAAE